MPVLNWMIRTRLFLGRHVTRSLNWLGLRVEDLRVTRPAPALVGRTPLPLALAEVKS
jgi:hypothetical protein